MVSAFMDEADESDLIAEYISVAALAGYSGDIHVSVHPIICIERLLCTRHCAGSGTQRSKGHDDQPARTSLPSTGHDQKMQFRVVETRGNRTAWKKALWRALASKPFCFRLRKQTSF